MNMAGSVDLKCIGVIGAGAMGAGIAQVTAAAGISVRLYDMQPDAADAAITKIESWFEKRVSDGKLSSQESDAIVANLSSAQALSDLAGCDLIIEAIIESPQATSD